VGEVTVYRTLDILSDLGLVCMVHTGEIPTAISDGHRSTTTILFAPIAARWSISLTATSPSWKTGSVRRMIYNP
jgi:hypothetical protein